jgi:glycerol uptake facilitator-like aquaporin
MSSWGLGVMLGLYVAGDSGAYLNPAITFCNCLFRQLPWRRFPVYFVAQLLGGFVGSGIVYANYISAIDYFEDGLRTVPPAKNATAAIFCTYPQPFLGKTNQFFSEFIASALLMFVIFALKDPSNNGVPKVSAPSAQVSTTLTAHRATNGSHCVSSFSSSVSARALVGRPATLSTLHVILAPG